MSKKTNLTIVRDVKDVPYDSHFSGPETYQSYLEAEAAVRKASIDVPSFSLGAIFAFIGFLIFGK